MAGKELSDVTFKQFSEAGRPDTQTGEMIANIGKAGVALTSIVAKEKLRNEVQKERDNFLAGIPGQQNRTDTTSYDTGQNMALDVGKIAEDARADMQIDTSIPEIQSYIAESQRFLRKQDQDPLLPIRALEMRVEAITRKYIDRFPGLATEFQTLAQRTLGTSNNLMAATLDAEEARLRAAAQAASDEREAVLDAAMSAGFNVRSGSSEQREKNLLRYMAWAELSAGIELDKKLAERAELDGQPSRAQHALHRVYIKQNQFVSTELARIIETEGLSELIGASFAEDSDQIVVARQRLEAHKFQLLAAVDANFLGQTNMSEGTRTMVSDMKTNITNFIDDLSESLGAGEVSTEVQARLNILQNMNAMDFERVMGRDALFLEKIFQFLPNESLAQLGLRLDVSREFLRKYADAFGERGLLSVLGEDPEVPLNNEQKIQITDAVRDAHMEAFVDYLNDPDAPLAAPFDAVKALRGINVEWDETNNEGQKDSMLRLMGSDRFKLWAAANASNPEVAETLQELDFKVRRWAGRVIDRSIEQLAKGINDSDMRFRFGIRSGFQGDTGQLEGRAVTEARRTRVEKIRPIDMFVPEIAEGRFMFRLKNKSELEALGVWTDEANMMRLADLQRELNRRLAGNLNKAAAAAGSLGQGTPTERVIAQALEEIASAPILTKE